MQQQQSAKKEEALKKYPTPKTSVNIQ